MRLVGHPVLCNYYVTYRCNARCGFCDIWERPSPYVTEAQVAENLRDLRRLGVRVIDFTGGEPLLHRRLDVLLRLAKAYGFITTVTTNGLLYPKWAERLRGLVDMLHFSLDAPDRDAHDASRGVACFDFVMRSLDVARALGERPDVLFTVTNDNTDQIERMWADICQPRGLMLILNPIFDYNAVETGGGLDAAALRTLSRWAGRPGVYLNEGFLRLRREGGNRTDRPVCRAASTTVVISPENELVLPCYHLGLRTFPLNGNLYERYHAPEVQQLVAQEGRYSGCEGCVINCYMQPSFAVEVSRYWWSALPSTLKYNREKGTWKALI